MTKEVATVSRVTDRQNFEGTADGWRGEEAWSSQSSFEPSSQMLMKHWKPAIVYIRYALPR